MPAKITLISVKVENNADATEHIRRDEEALGLRKLG